MKAFTKVVLEKNRSIKDIEEQLFLNTDGDDNKREEMLLATIQELADAIIAIKSRLEFRN